MMQSIEHVETMFDSLLTGQRPVFAGGLDRIEECPATTGIYLIEIRLDSPLEALPPTGATLPAGLYYYAGSAHGPGGLHARIRRHLAAEKKPRWHVDRLTMQSSAMQAWGWSEGLECDLVAALEKRHGFTHPLPRFGSSDCKRCRSHLLTR